MLNVNLGRVQGGSLFYSNANSGENIKMSTLSPIGLYPFVGDSILFSNGDIRSILKVIEDSTLYCSDVIANFNGQKYYSIIIRTQTEFESLISSSDWHGATSILFDGSIVGDMGFVCDSPDNRGIKIPQTVKQIEGINSAKLVVKNLNTDDASETGALWYSYKSYDDEYQVKNISVYSEGARACFVNCRNLTNCCAVNNGGIGFLECINLIDCDGKVDGEEVFAVYHLCEKLLNCNAMGNSRGRCHAFVNCSAMVNCSGNAYSILNSTASYPEAIAYFSCSDLINCFANPSGKKSYGFYGCQNMSNCNATPPNNNGEYVEYGYFDCKYCSSCRGIGVSGKHQTALWGGTNLKVSLDTCDTNDDGTIP